MSEVCSDNRFELIGEFKDKLVKGTNIETSPEEMAVLDNIIFRIWQMGWLDKLKSQEPRVMMLDLPPEEWQDKVIWLEIKGKKPIPCLFRKCCDRMMFGRYERIMSFDAIGSSKEGGFFLRNYGVNWRCWTSRPDEKRRAETPWDC